MRYQKIRPIVLLACLLALPYLTGCGLTSPDDGDDTLPTKPDNFSIYVPESDFGGAHLTLASTELNMYNIAVPGKTWSPWDNWTRIHLVRSDRVVPFSVLGYVEDSHNRRYVAVSAVTDESLEIETSGPVIWTRDESLELTIPVRAQVTGEIRDAILTYLQTLDSTPDSLEIAIRSLGMNSSLGLFLATAVPSGTVFEYNPNAPELPAWILLLDTSLTVHLQATLYAPGGYGPNKLLCTDMNQDGIADLVIIGLHAPAAPTRAYLFDSNSRWRWVGVYDSL